MGKTILIFITFLFVSCLNDSIDKKIKEEEKKTEIANNDAPIPGGGGNIIAKDIDENSFTLEWVLATDDFTLQEDLQYKVFYSQNNNISTFDDCEINGIEATSNWTLEFNSIKIIDLLSTQKYYFNIFVRDEEKKIESYVMGSAITDGVGGSIYLFSADDNKYRGKLSNNTNLEDIRTDIDNKCLSSSNAGSLAFSNVRAFISISEDDEIAKFINIDLYNIPDSWVVKGVSETKIANNWSDLMDGNIENKLQDANVVNHKWWSGSNADGTYNFNSCNNWTSDSNSVDGMIGTENHEDYKWISEKNEKCHTEQRIICVGW